VRLEPPAGAFKEGDFAHRARDRRNPAAAGFGAPLAAGSFLRGKRIPALFGIDYCAIRELNIFCQTELTGVA